MEHFEINDLENTGCYLGIDVTITDDGIKLSQRLYTDTLLSFGMGLCITPLNEGIVIDDSLDPSANVAEYQRLQYLSGKTILDIARTANLLANGIQGQPPNSGPCQNTSYTALPDSVIAALLTSYNKRTENEPPGLPIPTCCTDSDNDI
jgi:hypothetical protein